MGTGLPVAQYSIRVRDSSLNLVGELSNYDRALFTLRFNNVSSWAIQLDADDPLAASLAADGAGIQVLRTLRDPETNELLSSSVLFSGPRWGRARQFAGRVLVVSGFDDTITIAGRLAYQVTSYPYPAHVLALPGLLRYYKLNESAGTSATDSKSAITGTYSGGPSLQHTRTADDAAINPLFDGVNDVMTAPATSLPSGNSSQYLMAWFYYDSLPGSTLTLFWTGNSTEGTRTGIYFNVHSDGTVEVKTDAGTSPTLPLAGSAVAGVPHLGGAQWDGTNLTCWLDGVQIGTIAPGALNVGTSGLHVAEKISAGFFPGTIGHVAVGSGTLTAAQWLATYQLGANRFAAADSDAQTGDAETVLKHYVDLNAVTVIADQLGLSRVVPNLSIEANSHRGNSISLNARCDQLVTQAGDGLLQIGAQNGDLGFRVAQSGSGLVFSVYTPDDKTADVLFGSNLGNVADFQYSEDGPSFTDGSSGNAVQVAGGGQSTDRVFVARADTASITKWSRFEGFVDGRDTTDIPTLQERGDAMLAASASATQFALTLAPQRAIVYGSDFNLGDKVTCIIDGVAYEDIVREVQITLDRAGAETVVPAVGTPNADTIRRLFGGYAQQSSIANMRTVVSKLARSQ